MTVLNVLDGKVHQGLFKPIKGYRKANKITHSNETVDKVKNLREKGNSFQDIAELLGISQSLATKIYSGERRSQRDDTWPGPPPVEKVFGPWTPATTTISWIW